MKRMFFRTIALMLLMSLAWTLAAAGWVESYRSARNQALRENKKVLIFFTGSDWCVEGQTLERNLFRTDAFQRLADEKYVLYLADLPKYTRLGQAKEETNRHLARRYGITRFPAVVVVEPRFGGMVARQIGMSGGMTPKKLLEKLASIETGAARANRTRPAAPEEKR
ncbi:MAG: thioredoxin family protein [Lentisphaeria bacterium]|nr:thioredoxin family protein [Lentisphaeria bacterium]